MKAYIHHEHPKTVGRCEFWKQIKRTVNGESVSESDIKIIVDSVIGGLELNQSDSLLDLGCGNAALASNFFPLIKNYQGVDFSEYLLEIAQEYFFINKQTTFQNLDLRTSSHLINTDVNFNKGLLYGVASYFNEKQLIAILRNVFFEKIGLEKLYIGNIPNLHYAQSFFKKREISSYSLSDPDSAVGVWWDPAEFRMLLLKIGLESTLIFPPESFYGYPFRFDIVVSKSE
jgi:SAM-dependent methyltransferase